MPDALVPVLETERLRLRGHAGGDLDHCAALWASPDVTLHITGKPLTREDAWRRMLIYRGLWTLLGFGYWLVEEKATGRFVGEVGLADFKRDLEPLFEGAPEIGWVLSPHAHGRGLAHEAASAVLTWADATFGADHTVCMIGPGNGASLRLAAKLGYDEHARAHYRDEPVVLFRRPRGGKAAAPQ